MSLKRLYSGNIGKKNIVGSVVYENSSKKVVWNELKYIFVIPKKVKKIYLKKKMISSDIM